jgi:NAD+ kinase
MMRAKKKTGGRRKSVGVLARQDLAEAGPALADLVTWLGRRDVTALLESRTAKLLPRGDAKVSVAEGRQVAARADALVVLGGDGTLLGVSHLVARRSVPVLGVNFGSLGFLTEIALSELYPALTGVLEGKYEYDERRMLHAVVRRGGRPNEEGDVLNDVVVTKAALSRIIELDVFVNGLFVSAFRADGLIVSSPTGSTAYNLAAGGPILDPGLPAIVLTPICPHMLTNRPLVVGDDATIEVRLRRARDVEVHVTFDGQRGFALKGQDSVLVTRSPRSLRLVRAPARDFFAVLRTKLKWGESTARRR